MSVANLLVTDGTTSVQLDQSGGSAYIGAYGETGGGYTPTVANIDTADYDPTADEDRYAITEPTFAVTFQVDIATALSNITTLKRLFEQARRRRTNKAIPAVYIQFRNDSADPYMRTELLRGIVQERRDSFGSAWGAGYITCDITWRRREYLESLTETSPPLNNGNGTSSTGVTIWNHDDGDAGHDAYVYIAAADVTGDLPTPIRLEYTPGASYRYVDRLLIAHNVYNTPGSFTAIDDSGSGTADANANSGAYGIMAVGTGYTEIVSKLLGMPRLGYFNGDYFRLYMRLMTVPLADVSVYVAITGVGGTPVLWTSAPVTLSTTEFVHALTTLQVPPGGMPPTSAVPTLLLKVYAKRPTGATSLNLDYLFIAPLASWRVLTVGEPVGTFGVVDDMIVNYRYSLKDTGGGITGAVNDVNATGSPIMLVPNRDQVLHILKTKTGAAAHSIADTATFRIWYRQRRLSL